MSTPTSTRRRLLAFAATLALPPLHTHAEAPPLVLGTSTAGGGFALYGETLERILNRRSGRPLLRAQRTRGTAENLVLLREGKIDAALIQGTAASELLAQGPYEGREALANLLGWGFNVDEDTGSWELLDNMGEVVRSG